jgi:hypothetical protein
MSHPEITPAMWAVISDALEALQDNLDHYNVRPWEYRQILEDMPGALIHERGYVALLVAAQRAAVVNAEGLVRTPPVTP